MALKLYLALDVPLELIRIPSGEFLMGSPVGEPNSQYDETPQHLVRLERYWIGKYPVTVQQWNILCKLPPIQQRLAPFSVKGVHQCFLPVTQVSRLDVIEACNRLQQYTSHDFRLPTEAEWEYACRAGTTTPYYTGDTLNSSSANFDYQGFGFPHLEGLKPVGQCPPNPWGLHDMHGTVWEWCSNDWTRSYKTAKLSIPQVHFGVCRGGSWANMAKRCRSAARNSVLIRTSCATVGFRLAVTFDSLT